MLSISDKFIIGIDEAGRGPLAGPVSVGIVAFPVPEHVDSAEAISRLSLDIREMFPGVNDSKKLSEKKREQLFGMLEARVALGDAEYVVEFGSAADIDQKGIAVVIRSLISEGLGKLSPVSKSRRRLDLVGTPGDGGEDVEVLLDGSLKAPEGYKQQTIIGGDASVPIISLASIAAKVLRDRLMTEMAGKYPEYGFEKHKGYGTAFHYEKLREFGLSEIHRRTYIHLT